MKQLTKELVKLDDILNDLKMFSDKVEFCTVDLLELVETVTYQEYAEEERAEYFWNNRKRMQHLVEIARDYQLDHISELIDQARTEVKNLLGEGGADA